MAVSNKGFVLDYSDHMSSHYKRMASVKGRTDSSTPISMLKDVRRKSISKGNRNTKYREHKIDQTLDHDDILYQGCISTADSGAIPAQVHAPHTMTGQDMITISRRTYNSTDQSPRVSWNSSTNTNSKSIKTNTPPSKAPKTKSDKLNDNPRVSSDTSNHGDLPIADIQTNQDELIESRPFQTILTLKTSNELLKQSIAESEMDYEYNQFMLRITREILESDIENDDQIERILLSHVARSKQQLREDVMLAKLKIFRQSIGID